MNSSKNTRTHRPSYCPPPAASSMDYPQTDPSTYGRIVKHAETTVLPEGLAGSYRVIHGKIVVSRPTAEFTDARTGQPLKGVSKTLYATMGNEVLLGAHDALNMLEADIIEPMDGKQCRELRDALADFVARERARVDARFHESERSADRRLTDPAPEPPTDSVLVERCVALEAKIAGIYDQSSLKFKSRVNTVWTPPKVLGVNARGFSLEAIVAGAR